VQILAEVAGERHGVVTRRRLLAAGLSSGEITRRVRSGVLLVEYRGVYRLGHRAPSREARYAAAVAACGAGAVLCGRAAAHLHGLLRGPAPRAEVMTRGERRIGGISTCRCRRFDPRDATEVLGIPVTTVARLWWISARYWVSMPSLVPVTRRVFSTARRPGRSRRCSSAARTAPGRAGSGRVLRGDVRVTLSTLERRFLALLNAEKLPLPETNRIAGGRRVDCRWPAHRLTIELDSYRFHRSRHAWEEDRRREREARARGDEFRRCRYATTGQDSVRFRRPSPAPSPGRSRARPSGATRSPRGPRR
jgi:hypothetical protein